MNGNRHALYGIEARGIGLYLEVGRASPYAVTSGADDGGLVHMAGADEAVKQFSTCTRSGRIISSLGTIGVFANYLVSM